MPGHYGKKKAAPAAKKAAAPKKKPNKSGPEWAYMMPNGDRVSPEMAKEQGLKIKTMVNTRTGDRASAAASRATGGSLGRMKKGK